MQNARLLFECNTTGAQAFLKSVKSETMHVYKVITNHRSDWNLKRVQKTNVSINGGDVCLNEVKYRISLASWDNGTKPFLYISLRRS